MALNKHTFVRTDVNGIRLHVLPTRQFKTFAIAAYLGWPLSEEWVTPIALSSFVLRRGNERYPETKQFRERLDDLYGAGFGFDVYKRGDYQIVLFRMDVIEDRYVGSKEPLLQEALQFIGSTIARPARERGKLLEKYVQAEKETVQKKLEAVINDKIRYAAERCLEEMCAGEPYRLHPLGRIEDLAGYDAAALTERYEQWLSTAPLDLYIVGNTTPEEAAGYVASAFASGRGIAGAPGTYRTRVGAPERRETKTVVERLDVNQGKLNMGLRADITYADELYPAALMYNGILGAYPHSKLFVNVREKASLAYYVSSRLDGHKGILTIQSGIEIGNYEQAVGIIREQLDALRSGNISDLELEQTRAMIGNQLRESQDSAFEIISLDFNGVLSGRARSVEELQADLARVDRAAVQAIAERMHLDTIYFLRDGKEA